MISLIRFFKSKKSKDSKTTTNANDIKKLYEHLNSNLRYLTGEKCMFRGIKPIYIQDHKNHKNYCRNLRDKPLDFPLNKAMQITIDGKRDDYLILVGLAVEIDTEIYSYYDTIAQGINVQLVDIVGDQLGTKLMSGTNIKIPDDIEAFQKHRKEQKLKRRSEKKYSHTPCNIRAGNWDNSITKAMDRVCRTKGKFPIYDNFEQEMSELPKHLQIKEKH